jgi:hypothetical protein
LTVSNIQPGLSDLPAGLAPKALARLATLSASGKGWLLTFGMGYGCFNHRFFKRSFVSDAKPPAVELCWGRNRAIIVSMAGAL